MVPLVEILADTFAVRISTKKVKNEYKRMTENLGMEIEILLQTKPEEIERVAGPDGVFGKVCVWPICTLPTLLGCAPLQQRMLL